MELVEGEDLSEPIGGLETQRFHLRQPPGPAGAPINVVVNWPSLVTKVEGNK